MPPFLFNRMSNGVCALPFPPPLPQISSLPLAPAVQQIVMDRYTNPFAVLPFTPLMPVSAFAFAPQQDLFNRAVFPPATYFDAKPPIPQQAHNHDPSICRACPPAPPELNIPVSKYHWIQHCSACRCTPNSSFHSNVRPTRGRITPLLGPSISSDQSIGSNQYPHVNSSHIQPPWTSKIPPLPPGAIVVADHYLTRNQGDQHWSPNIPYFDPSEQRGRPVGTSSKDYPIQKRTYRSNSPRKAKKTERLAPRQLASTGESTYSSTCSSPINESDEQPRGALVSQTSRNSFARKQLSAAARFLNFRYRYQPQEFSSVYQKNRYLKSTTTESLTSSTSIPSTKLSLILVKEYSRRQPPPPPQHFNPIRSSSPVSMRSGKSSVKSVIVREFATRPPSVASTIFSDAELIIVRKEIDKLKEDVKSLAVHDTISFKDF
jgi:hypothetical protein